MSTLCSGRGIWTVEADFPTYQPPVVRWKYNVSDNWSEIVGDYWTVTQSEGSLDNYFYNVTVYRRAYSYDHSRQPSGDGLNTYTNLKGKIIGLGTFDSTNPNAHYGIIYNSGAQLRSIGLNYQFKIAWPYDNFTGYWIAEIVNTVRVDTNQPDTIYTLKIFYNGQLVHSSSSDKNPLVELLPEQCNFNGDWQEIHKETNLEQSAFLSSQSLSNNRVLLKKCLASVDVETNQITSVCEPLQELQGECNAPKLRGEVEPLCPDETCEIENCGATICCYDSNGNPIKSY